MQASPGAYHHQIEAALRRLTAERIIPRIWQHDHTVWKPDPAEIANRLGWLHAPETMRAHIDDIMALVEAVQAEGYTQALLLGMGGSSLAPEVFSRMFGGVPPERLKLAVLDSTDPGAVLAQAAQHDPAQTLYIVSTKSGGTVETLSFFKFFYNRAVEALGVAKAGQHFVAITDGGSRLDALAREHRFRSLFLNDPTIGGRNAALSLFGLVPAALVGVDLARLLDRGAAMAALCQGTEAADNPGAWLGAILGTLAGLGRDKLTLVCAPELASFADWVEQLIAESTGKEGKGIVPVAHEPLGPPEVYGEDRVFVSLQLGEDAPDEAALARLEEAGHPVVRLSLADRYDVGGQYFLWEMATAVASHLLGVNSFDQPNVESAKARARELVAAYTERGQLPGVESAPLTAEALRRFLAEARPGDYVALQAYLTPTEATTVALQALRLELRDTYRLATTLGYGPRYLHSTGQLHKGDRGNGLFLQFIAGTVQDVPIPDSAGEAASSITFGVLKEAQAAGDYLALVENERRVIRFDLGADVLTGLRRLAMH